MQTALSRIRPWVTVSIFYNNKQSTTNASSVWKELKNDIDSIPMNMLIYTLQGNWIFWFLNLLYKAIIIILL